VNTHGLVWRTCLHNSLPTSPWKKFGFSGQKVCRYSYHTRCYHISLLFQNLLYTSMIIFAIGFTALWGSQGLHQILYELSMCLLFAIGYHVADHRSCCRWCRRRWHCKLFWVITRKSLRSENRPKWSQALSVTWSVPLLPALFSVASSAVSVVLRRIPSTEPCWFQRGVLRH